MLPVFLMLGALFLASVTETNRESSGIAVGWSEAAAQDSEGPAFLVVYYVSLKEKLDDWGRTYDGPHVVYVQGTLILDFVDPKTKKVFWRGWQRKC